MRLTVRKSITLRLTLLFASASSIVLLLLGFLIAVSVDQHFEAQDMEVLSGKLKLTQHALEKIRSKAELDQLPQLLEDALVGHQGLELVVVKQFFMLQTEPSFQKRYWIAMSMRIAQGQ